MASRPAHGQVGATRQLPSGTDAASSISPNGYLFTGRRYDSETGLYHYRTRYLDPTVGVFTARDTIGLWGDALNLGNGLTYVAANPWSHVDPYGAEVYPDNFIGPLMVTDVRESELSSNPSAFSFSYDGSELSLNKKGVGAVGSVPAYSGMPGARARDQVIEEFGPIPEGNYVLDPARTQDYLGNRRRVILNDWLGLHDFDAWGRCSTLITLARRADVGTRGAFYLHGGTKPGSKGCIDVVENNRRVHRWLRLLGISTGLTIDYPSPETLTAPEEE